MSKPFSLMDQMRDRPFAIGDSNRHVPLQPHLSGQAAVDSLIGYYPSKKKMDSQVNPHTFVPATEGRATEMPNMKIANLRDLGADQVADAAMATIDASQSGLVTGFLEKCATAQLTPLETVNAIFRAQDCHPAIEAEFEKCGFVRRMNYGAARSYTSSKPKIAPAPSRSHVKKYSMGPIRRGAFSPDQVAQSTAATTAPEMPKTPSIATLAKKGINYTQGNYRYMAPSGTPSRASMSTGQYPQGRMVPKMGTPEWDRYTAYHDQQRQISADRAVADAKHPYYAGHRGSNAEMPETLGGFRTGEGFDADYQRWIDMINPETAGKQFQELVDKTGMDPQTLVRALAASRHMEEQFPFLNRETRTAAQERFDNDPNARRNGQQRPGRVSFQDRMRAFHSLPDEYQTALGQWQGHQVGNWKEPGYKTPKEFSSAPVSIGFSGQPDWTFPAFPEDRHSSFDQQGRPNMLDPEKYMGLQELGDRYGIDFRNKDFRDYWRKQQEHYADYRKNGWENEDEQWNGPASTVRGYWWDRERRQGKHDFENQEADPTMLMQRLAGFRRTDPRTGKEVITVGDRIGQDPGGLSGAFKNTVLGGYSAPGYAVYSLAEGDPRYAHMDGRSILSLLNHTMGSDFGHNVNHSAGPAGMGKGEEGESTNIGRNLATTRGMYNDVYDPLTGTYKPSDVHSVGSYYDRIADDPDTSPLGRVAARGMQTTMNKGPDVIYNLALMKALRMPLTMKNLAIMSAASNSLPNLVDPNSPSPGLWSRGGEALEGALLPFSGNPLFPMIGQGVKEIPGSKHYYDTADRLRLQTSANPDAPEWLQRLGGGGAAAMDVVPDLLATRSLGSGSRQLGRLVPGAAGATLRNTPLLTKRLLRTITGGQGLAGAVGHDPNSIEGERARILERLKLDRTGQMQFDMGKDMYRGALDQMARGVEIDDERLKIIGQKLVNKAQRELFAKLVEMSPAQRSITLQQAGMDAGPNNPYGQSQPAPEPEPEPPAAGGNPDQQWWSANVPGFGDVANFAKQKPEKAQAYADQAMDQVKEFFGGNQQEAQTIAQTGRASPAIERLAAGQLQHQGMKPEGIFGFLENMSGWEKFGLAAGLGVTALGLVNMVSGNGGIGSMIMSVLGLGGAAYAAANSGVFGEGAKNLRGDVDRGFGDLVSGGGQALGLGGGPEISPGAEKMMKQFAPSIMSLPPAALKPILSYIRANHPGVTKQLNMASGDGSWGNAALSFLGDISGQRQRMMQDRLGLNPQQQDKLLGLWSQTANPTQPAFTGAQ